MLRNRGHWRRRPISLTPLIDIIFLLLLFFMLSSTFTRFAEVPLVNAGTVAADTGAAPVLVQLGADTVRVNGDIAALAAVPDRLASLREGGEATALITLDDTVSSQRLVDLLVLLQGLPWLSVAVLE
jgi:biopolymer transport protein ExbD